MAETMVETIPDSLEQRQLQWKRLQLNCRRGNAEVEHLLTAYCRGLSPEATSQVAEMEILETLLAENDQTLFEWLVQPDLDGADTTPDMFKPLIQAIRSRYLSA